MGEVAVIVADSTPQKHIAQLLSVAQIGMLGACDEAGIIAVEGMVFLPGVGREGVHEKELLRTLFNEAVGL